MKFSTILAVLSLGMVLLMGGAGAGKVEIEMPCQKDSDCISGACNTYDGEKYCGTRL